MSQVLFLSKKKSFAEVITSRLKERKKKGELTIAYIPSSSTYVCMFISDFIFVLLFSHSVPAMSLPLVPESIFPSA